MSDAPLAVVFARQRPTARRDAWVVGDSDPVCICGASVHRSPIRSPQVRTRCFRAQALHLPCPPYPMGFVMRCQLARRPGLLCSFCPSPRTFALRLPPDKPSRPCPCLRLVVIINPSWIHVGTPTGDFHPITPRPCWAHTHHSRGPARKAAQAGEFRRWASQEDA